MFIYASIFHSSRLNLFVIQSKCYPHGLIPKDATHKNPAMGFRPKYMSFRAIMEYPVLEETHKNDGAPFLVSVPCSSFSTQNFPLLSSKFKDDILNPTNHSPFPEKFLIFRQLQSAGRAVMKLCWVYVWEIKALSREYKASCPFAPTKRR